MNNVIIYEKNAFESGIIKIKGRAENLVFELLIDNKGKLVAHKEIEKIIRAKSVISKLRTQIEKAYDILSYNDRGYILTDKAKRKIDKRKKRWKNLKGRF